MIKQFFLKNTSITRVISFGAALLFAAALIGGGNGLLFSQTAQIIIPSELSTNTKACLKCHNNKTPALVAQWHKSKHYENNFGCYECHRAASSEKDALQHNGFLISVIVSPGDCSNCHMQEAGDFHASNHAKAIDCVTGSVGKLVAEYLLGNNELKTAAFPKGASAANANGCWRCHGCEVKVDQNGKLDPATWPNTGIGRINPDGSKGSCSACHPGHAFSATAARRPETCKKCHAGKASLFEYAIYMQSRHGINYANNTDGMNLDSSPWVAGVNYTAAPTCATCHMTAAPTIAPTHNVSLRLIKGGYINKKIMKKVCAACHTATLFENYYQQASAQAALVKNKWKDPATDIYAAAVDLLKEIKGDKYNLLTNPIDFTYSGITKNVNVAGLAAFMLSPQIVEDNNMALATTWYSTFIPQVQALIDKGMKSPQTTPLAKTLKDKLDCWTGQATYGNSKWPKGSLFDGPLADCPKKR
ncbi:MAG: hydroxylamine oxidoreductase [bacterium]|nr:hydroxylamine oxidoreductase [bacterium]